MYGRGSLLFIVIDSLHDERLTQQVARERRENIASLGVQKDDDFKRALYVVVVGESANRNHLHLYGYFRETTPFLDARKDEMVVFHNAIASFSSTILSLRRALTLATVSSGKEYYDDGMYSIIEILRGAGVKTYWISNQAKWGLWGIGTSLIASGADDVFFERDRASVDATAWASDSAVKSKGMMLIDARGRVQTPLDYASNLSDEDGVLMDRIDNVLAKEDGPAVLFVHLMGSHTLYANRYPQAFEKFAPQDDKDLFGDKIETARVNSYDNSILYTDYILDQIIRRLQAKAMPTSLLYFSDHGESVDINKQHDPSDFTPGHVEVPLLLWFSQAYKDAYPDTVLHAQTHSDAPFMNDSLSQVMMDWTHVHGSFSQPLRSLLNATFVPSPRLTMDGAVDYDKLPDSYCAVVKAKTGFGMKKC